MRDLLCKFENRFYKVRALKIDLGCVILDVDTVFTARGHQC